MDTEQEYSLYIEQEYRIPWLRNVEYSEDSYNLRSCN